MKENLFKNYDKLFKKNIDGGQIVKINSEENTVSANWMYCIIIDDLNFKDFENYMNEKLIQIRPFFYDIRKHEHLKGIKCVYEECNVIKNGAMLPSYPGLELEKQEHISNCIKEYLE